MEKVKSITDLLKLKEKLEKEDKKTFTFHSARLESDIIYKKATRSLILASSDLGRQDADLNLIYNCVIEPDLSDKKLQEAFNKGNPPYMIVEKLFSIMEIGELSKLTVMDEVGKSNENFLKNS